MTSIKNNLRCQVPIIIAVLFMFFVFNFGCKAEIKKPAARNNENMAQIADYVQVYYFHGNFRCKSCHLIETMTTDIIQNSFKSNLTSKALRFKIINIEESENTHFIKDYGLYSKAVVLSLVQDNKEIKYKNLNKIWTYLSNKKTFENYIESEIRAFLKERI